MKTKILIVLLLITVVLLTGCTQQSTPAQSSIKSQEQVQQVVSNVTDNIGDIQDTLNDIDQKFG